MLRRSCKDQDIKMIKDYIGEKYKMTPYLYANAMAYGKGTDHVRTWIDENQAGEIEGIFLMYFDCLHFFTNIDDIYPVEKFLNAKELLSPKVIMVMDSFGKRLTGYLQNNFELERNYVIDMDLVGIENKEYKSVIAKREDIEQIVHLMISDHEYVNVYDKDVLRSQLYERFDNNFSRYFVLYQDGKVVATCSTYGEVPGFALVGGVIVHPDYRRRGYAADVENFACHVLLSEGISKVGFVNFNNTASLALHEKLGAKSISILNKFVRI